MPNWISRLLHPTNGEPVAEPAQAEDWFTPRTDGVYEGGPDAYRYITFTADGRVWIADSDHHPGCNTIEALDVPLTGSYTGAGRFIVARTFQRPTVFVVSDATHDALRLRITDTTTQHTAEHTYTYRPAT